MIFCVSLGQTLKRWALQRALHTSDFHFLAVGGNRPFRRRYIAVSA